MFYAEMIMVSLNAWDFLIYFKVLTVKKEQKKIYYLIKLH